ncbi:hypothetical protein RvY_17610-3 [Ramazzottius varieornatus]|uniref:Uncharacterized protein n=1 Tax=Ramazzottius varieornatus TaxID=947166 RepID=A0A1D1W2R8_RAMVA|nr:hypothetical protein RvY_17610-3 [Ramazzottius varieornatus]
MEKIKNEHGQALQYRKSLKSSGISKFAMDDESKIVRIIIVTKYWSSVHLKSMHIFPTGQNQTRLDCQRQGTGCHLKYLRDLRWVVPFRLKTKCNRGSRTNGIGCLSRNQAAFRCFDLQ